MGTVGQLVALSGVSSWREGASVRSGPFAVCVDVLLALAAVAYAGGLWREHRRRSRGDGGAVVGRGQEAWASASFLLGLFLLFVSLGSGVARHPASDPSVDVVQHLLLMMVAPPLLALGRPAGAACALVGRSAGHRDPGRIRLGWRAASGIGSWPLYYGSMAAYFLTPLYRASLADAALLDLTEAAFVGIGLLFWTGLLGAGGAGAPRSRAFRIVAVVAGMPAETAVGLALLVWPRPIDPAATLAATHAAGLLLWLGCMLTSGVALAVLLVQWCVEDVRGDDRRGDFETAFFEAVRPDGGGPWRPAPRARWPSRP